MGCLLAQFLVTGRRSNTIEAATLLFRALQDARFSLDAAYQLLRNFEAGDPKDIDPEQWSRVVAMARDIVRATGEGGD